MAQSEEGTASPSAGGGANRLEDGFVPVLKDEPMSPAPPSATKVVSRFFSNPPGAFSDGAVAARGDAPLHRRRGKMQRTHASLPDAVADARLALDDFRAAAAKKNAHKDHEDAAESVLIPFRPFVDARTAAHADAASGEVLFVREKTQDGDEIDKKIDAFGDDAMHLAISRTTTTGRQLRARAADSDLPGATDAGTILSLTLTELDRLHVNASCRVRQRAPAVAAARARLTQLRRECRDAFKALDPRGVSKRTEAVRAAKRSLPAARDAAHFALGSIPGSIHELRDRCPLFASTGSPHHLCLHLCYYREYDPARQMFVLRTRCAAAKGSAAELDGWRADLVLAPEPKERGTPKKKKRRNGDEDDDDVDEDLDDDLDDGSSSDDESIEQAVVRKRKRKRKRRIEDGGWLAGKSLPWRVRFQSPEGEVFDDGADVLAKLGVDALNAGPAAMNANGGGGLGNETIDDFDWAGAAERRDTNVGSPGTRVRGLGSPQGNNRTGARARGQVAPAPRPLDMGLGAVRSTHGGSGVRLARPETSGLDEATDLLRAALWPARMDDFVGTEPVRARRDARRRGEPRSPFRLAPDPFDERAAPPPPPPGGSDERRGGDTGEGGAEWWSPPRSPFGLLEEILWSDEWKLLVACMMLNCTTRLQVDRVLWRLFLLVPTPEDAIRLGADEGGLGDGFGPEGEKSGLDRIEEILRPLGLHRKRARALVKLSEDYVSAKGAAALPEGGPPGAEGDDVEGGVIGAEGGAIGGAPNNSSRLRVPVASLHGVGAYASDAHAMFCEGLLGVAPRDHALRWWYAWALERRESERRERRAAAQAAR